MSCKSLTPWTKFLLLEYYTLFKMYRNSKAIHEGADILLFPYFMIILAAAAFTAGVSVGSQLSRHRKEHRALTAGCKDVNHLFETFATDDIIAETDTKIMRLPQSLNM